MSEILRELRDACIYRDAAIAMNVDSGTKNYALDRYYAALTAANKALERQPAALPGRHTEMIRTLEARHDES
jgi:hypothetical protein